MAVVREMFSEEVFMNECIAVLRANTYEDYEDVLYDYDFYGGFETVIKSYNTANLGVSLGNKWKIKNKISFSTILGIGRSIGTTKSPEFFPRVSIALGIY